MQYRPVFCPQPTLCSLITGHTIMVRPSRFADSHSHSPSPNQEVQQVSGRTKDCRRARYTCRTLQRETEARRAPGDRAQGKNARQSPSQPRVQDPQREPSPLAEPWSLLLQLQFSPAPPPPHWSLGTSSGSNTPSNRLSPRGNRQDPASVMGNKVHRQ